MDQILVDVPDAARLLGGISPRTVRRMLSDGRLTPVRVGRRVLVSVRQLEEIAQTHLPGIEAARAVV